MTVDGIAIATVIDTGASASFLPREGVVIRGNPDKLVPTATRTRVADNGRLNCTHVYDGKIGMRVKPDLKDVVRFYVINSIHDILGYDALIGTDLIKRLGVSIKPTETKLEAYLGEIRIGNEDKHAPMETPVGAVQKTRTEEGARLERIIQDYAQVFADRAEGVMDTTPMKIPLESERVPKARLRQQSPDDTG